MAEKTILIVDDDESLVRALAIKLRDSGYKVLAAWDAVQAVSQAKRHVPDLILLDIRMPEGGGLIVMDALAHTIKTMNIPIIVLTALENDEVREEAMSYGAIDYFKKPIDIPRLLSVIGVALSDGTGEGG